MSTTRPLRVLLVTSEWPTAEHPEWAPFVTLQVEYLRRAGVDVDVLPFRGKKNPVNYFSAWRQARERLRRRKYDLLHAHFGQSGLLALPKSLPLVVTFHGSDLEGIVGTSARYLPEGYVLRALSRTIARVADKIILVSASLARRLPKRCSYEVIAGGVDLDLFRPIEKKSARRALQLPEETPLALFAGRADNPGKRYDLACRAVDLVRLPSRPRLIVADGVPHHQMPTYMNACDVLLLTSLHEGSPTVVKEALACNLPVVSTAVGDVPERLSGIDGCAVYSDDRPETIAAALERVLASRAPFRGRETAGESLSEASTVRKVLGVYDLALRR